MLCMLQVSPQDEGLSSEPECEIHCYSWSRQAPAPDTPSREEAGALHAAVILISYSHCITIERF